MISDEILKYYKIKLDPIESEKLFVPNINCILANFFLLEDNHFKYLGWQLLHNILQFMLLKELVVLRNIPGTRQLLQYS